MKILFTTLVLCLSVGFVKADPPQVQPMPGIAPVVMERASLGIILSSKEKGSIRIAELKKDSAFEKADGMVGDVIMNIGKDRINNRDDLAKAMKNYKPGDKVEVKVMRTEKRYTYEKKLTVTLGTEKVVVNDSCLLPPPVPQICPAPPFPQEKGVIVIERATLGVKMPETNKKEEAKVLEFIKDSPFEKAGGKVGDVIVKVGKKEIKHTWDIMGAMYDNQPGKEVVVEVKRGEKTETLKVTLGKEVKKFGTGVIIDPNKPNPVVPPLPPLVPRPNG